MCHSSTRERRFAEHTARSIALLCLSALAHAGEPSPHVSMNPEIVLMLNQLKLTQRQADALAPLIRTAVDSIHRMIDREALLAYSYPNQDMLFRKGRRLFNSLDGEVRNVLRQDQWPAYERFKRFAVDRICRSSYEIRGRADGPGVMLDVMPE